MAFTKQLATIVEKNGKRTNLLYDQNGCLLAYVANDVVNYYKPGYNRFVTQLLKESNEKITYEYAQQDESGKIIQLARYTNGLPESRTEFSYNENGQLAKRTISIDNNKQEFVYTYKEGNLVKIQEYENAMLKSTIHFDHYHNQPNSIAVDLFDWKQIGFVSDGHFGMPSKNLTKSLEIITPGSPAITLQYVYKSDADGYVRSMKIESNGEMLKHYNFIFQ
ncbi:hypothetical protein [Lacibacter luteus]|nr:hypothetical protein [Lacibacter luteus]